MREINGNVIRIGIPADIGVQEITMGRYQREVGIIFVSTQRDGEAPIDDGQGQYEGGPFIYPVRARDRFNSSSRPFTVILRAIMFWGNVQEDANRAELYEYEDHAQIDFIRDPGGTINDVNTRVILRYTAPIPLTRH